MRKTVFYIISTITWVACISIVALVWLEHLGGYDFIEDIEKSDQENFELYESNYYGAPLETNPYEAFSIQHLHPFYMFSLPWTQDAIRNANNDIVSLSPAGFRNSFQNNAPMAGIFLGGSTSFGHGASSDLTTISSALNKLQNDYEFLNYGSPSWNSHQEMVAYAKYPERTGYVISFSGANDFNIALRYCKKGYEFPLGSPGSFEYLADITDDIRGVRHGSGTISRLFPVTSKKLSRLFDNLGVSRKPSADCKSQLLEVADAFIRNQSVVRELAVARGSGYLLALQPHIHFIVQPNKQRRIEDAELRREFYQHVMESPFCQAADCVDFSETFKDAVPLRINEAPEDPNRAIFVDKVHLTDHGNARIAALLNAMIHR